MTNRAVFLDKDGTLIEDVPYNVKPDLIKLTQGAIAGLQLIQAHAYKLIVISNQSGVARGYFPELELLVVKEHLCKLLSQQDITLDDFYYCPHHPDGVVAEYAITCECRKPEPGLILRAAYEHNIDLQKSWFIGDILNDVEAGQRAGCKTILIDNGNETQWQLSPMRIPHYVVSDLATAAQTITRNDHK
ncbi:HAD family hydrolase [Fischerella sp. JS2]|uniref:D-glycero-alpha-D-manno-heptose-1,7-bisphosphate 7-phosphatase n=1 Tax=Fischerella sp. JS2 TaxID=2597771 RepID=UPI0028E3DB9F|nr:HAD family hydrolase [Fischerella sp. JS2]